MFSLRIVTVDHYLSAPEKGFDVTFSDFRGAEIYKVPVIRVFGVTPAGQKCCLHVHGVFPYLSVPYDEDLSVDQTSSDFRKYSQELAYSIDKALNVALRKSNSTRHHVYKITLESRLPFYGYHEKEQPFLKIFFYNPVDIKKTMELLSTGLIMNKTIQPYEAHIPYILQFFIDYNLFGMNLINLRSLKFRSPCEQPGTSLVIQQSPGQSFEQNLSSKIWDNNTLKSLEMFSDIKKQTSCELEADCCTNNILNHTEGRANQGKNPGLLEIWEEEKQRRRERNESSQIAPATSQDRSQVIRSKSDILFLERLKQILNEKNLESGENCSSLKETHYVNASTAEDTNSSFNQDSILCSQDKDMLSMVLSIINSQSYQCEDEGDSILSCQFQNPEEDESDETLEMSHIIMDEDNAECSFDDLASPIQKTCSLNVNNTAHKNIENDRPSSVQNSQESYSLSNFSPLPIDDSENEMDCRISQLDGADDLDDFRKPRARRSGKTRLASVATAHKVNQSVVLNKPNNIPGKSEYQVKDKDLKTFQCDTDSDQSVHCSPLQSSVANLSTNTMQEKNVKELKIVLDDVANPNCEKQKGHYILSPKKSSARIKSTNNLSRKKKYLPISGLHTYSPSKTKSEIKTKNSLVMSSRESDSSKYHVNSFNVFPNDFNNSTGNKKIVSDSNLQLRSSSKYVLPSSKGNQVNEKNFVKSVKKCGTSKNILHNKLSSKTFKLRTVNLPSKSQSQGNHIKTCEMKVKKRQHLPAADLYVQKCKSAASCNGNIPSNIIIPPYARHLDLRKIGHEKVMLMRETHENVNHKEGNNTFMPLLVSDFPDEDEEIQDVLFSLAFLSPVASSCGSTVTPPRCWSPNYLISESFEDGENCNMQSMIENHKCKNVCISENTGNAGSSLDHLLDDCLSEPSTEQNSVLSNDDKLYLSNSFYPCDHCNKSDVQTPRQDKVSESVDGHSLSSDMKNSVGKSENMSQVCSKTYCDVIQNVNSAQNEVSVSHIVHGVFYHNAVSSESSCGMHCTESEFTKEHEMLDVSKGNFGSSSNSTQSMQDKTSDTSTNTSMNKLNDVKQDESCKESKSVKHKILGKKLNSIRKNRVSIRSAPESDELFISKETEMNMENDHPTVLDCFQVPSSSETNLPTKPETHQDPFSWDCKAITNKKCQVETNAIGNTICCSTICNQVNDSEKFSYVPSHVAKDSVKAYSKCSEIANNILHFTKANSLIANKNSCAVPQVPNEENATVCEEIGLDGNISCRKTTKSHEIAGVHSAQNKQVALVDCQVFEVCSKAYSTKKQETKVSPIVYQAMSDKNHELLEQNLSEISVEDEMDTKSLSSPKNSTIKQSQGNNAVLDVLNNCEPKCNIDSQNGYRGNLSTVTEENKLNITSGYSLCDEAPMESFYCYQSPSVLHNSSAWNSSLHHHHSNYRMCTSSQNNEISVTKKKTFVLQPKEKPPSRVHVENTYDLYDIPEERHQEAFFSNPLDIIGGKQLLGHVSKAKSTKTSEFLDFDGKFQISAVNAVTLNLASLPQFNMSSPSSSFHLPDVILKNPEMKVTLAGNRPVVLTPVCLPPSRRKVEKWLKLHNVATTSKQEMLVHSDQENAKSGTKTGPKECVKSQINGGPLKKLKPELVVSQVSNLCLKFRDSNVHHQEEISPILPLGTQAILTPSKSLTEYRHFKKCLHSVSTPLSEFTLKKIPLHGESSASVRQPEVMEPCGSKGNSLCESSLLSSHKGVLPLSPIIPRKISHLQSLKRKRKLFKEENSTCTKSSKGFIKLNETHCRKKVLLKAVDAYSEQSNTSCSQIEGPSYENTGNFKVNLGKIGDARSVHMNQYLTIMSVELHINTRSGLRPDPEHDAVAAVFYYVYNDAEHGNCMRQEMFGFIVLDDDTRGSFRTESGLKNQEAHSRVNTSENPESGKPSTSLLNNVHESQPAENVIETHDVQSSDFFTKNLAYKLKTNLHVMTGIENVTVIPVQDEIMLFKELSSVVKRWDPDILVGYEIQMLSWGYLLQRASHLKINLLSSLSRIEESEKEQLYNANNAPEFDEYGSEHSSEIHIDGRIVLNVWRIMRKEVTLNRYSFENVYYHVLHQRTPLYSFETLTRWYTGKSSMKHRVFDYYVIRTWGTAKLMEHLDVVARVSELARVFGIQFYDVLNRGSQFRVESMMLRSAKSSNYIPVSPTVRQRSTSRAPECVALIMEPESRFYSDPVVVLDFQSLYPSMMIAYNYCFSTCLGRIEHLGKNCPFDFGCTSLSVPVKTLLKLKDNLHFSPTGIAFVDSSVRQGILAQLLNEILTTRIMVKQSLKAETADKTLKKLLDARQLGLKLIANVTYGYSAANYSGRMPCVEVADSIVGKARETLERAIHLVENNPKWKARVVYGDTDSMFVLLRGKSKYQAFKIGQEIADVVTQANPKPVKLKFEKVYLPCVLLSKKHYVGFMYETMDQKDPVYDAKGIETVRRDTCPAVSKILEKSLKILFNTRDASLVKMFVQKQFSKLLSGRSSIIDCIFAKEYRGLGGYRPGACVPALEITKKRLRKDPRSEPRVGERVPYVIVYGFPTLPLIQLVREPEELLEDKSLHINSKYYITRVIIPPLDRVFSLIGIDVKTWYTNMPHLHLPSLPTVPISNRTKGRTLSQYFTALSCPVCDQPTNLGICSTCQQDPQMTCVILNDKVRQWERTVHHLNKICTSCAKFKDTENFCLSVDCPVMFRLNQAKRDLEQEPYIRNVLMLDFF